MSLGALKRVLDSLSSILILWWIVSRFLRNLRRISHVLALIPNMCCSKIHSREMTSLLYHIYVFERPNTWNILIIIHPYTMMNIITIFKHPPTHFTRINITNYQPRTATKKTILETLKCLTLGKAPKHVELKSKYKRYEVLECRVCKKKHSRGILCMLGISAWGEVIKGKNATRLTCFLKLGKDTCVTNEIRDRVLHNNNVD
jgi:hypothetical protein